MFFLNLTKKKADLYKKVCGVTDKQIFLNVKKIILILLKTKSHVLNKISEIQARNYTDKVMTSNAIVFVPLRKFPINFPIDFE